LLVVIALVGILAALLLPALNRAKEQARSATCISNLRQLGIALTLYVHDFGAYPIGYSSYFAPPGLGGTDPIKYPMYWFELLYPYTHDRWVVSHWSFQSSGSADGMVEGTGIWSCPSLANVEIGWPFQFGGYQYDSTGCGRGPDGRTLGLAGDLNLENPGSGPPLSQPIRWSDVSAPAMMLAMGDLDAEVLDSDRYPPPAPTVVLPKVNLEPVSAAGWIAVGIIPDQPTNRVLKAWQQAIGRRHDGRWQMSYCDGHVEKNKVNDLFDIRIQQVRSRWNRDDAPHPEINLKISAIVD
jgi:prepilin-type processing-associated H-X9-DG protein